MPRLMSVAFTEDAVVARTKTVTRRNGWRFVKAGDQLTLCRKVMGRKPGEPLVRVAEVEVVSVRRELLSEITADEVALEGFPGMAPAEFVRRFFVDAQGMDQAAEVTRIEWKYLDGAGLSVAHRTLCDGRDHVPPVGFTEGDPYEPDDHGEVFSGGQGEQCMCGHPTYYTCPDWLGIDDEGNNPRG